MAFSIRTLKRISKTGLRDALIKAVKKANPNLTDLNFEDFTFTREDVENKHDVVISNPNLDVSENGMAVNL